MEKASVLIVAAAREKAADEHSYLTMVVIFIYVSLCLCDGFLFERDLIKYYF